MAKEKVQLALEKIKKRAFRKGFLRITVSGIVEGSLVVSLLIFGWLLWMIMAENVKWSLSWEPTWYFWKGVWLSLLGVFAFCLFRFLFWRPPSTYEVAIQVDHQCRLKDSLSTSVYLSLKKLSLPKEVEEKIYKKAEESLSKVEKREWEIASTAKTPSPLTGLVLFFALFTTGFLKPSQKAVSSPIEEDPAISVLKKAASEIKKEAEKEKLKEGEKVGEILKKAAEEMKGLPPRQRKKALAKWEKKLKELKREVKRKLFEKALRRAIRALEKSKHTRSIAKKLKRREFQGAEKLAKALRKNVASQKKAWKSLEKEKLKKAAKQAGEALERTKLDALARELKSIAKMLGGKEEKRKKKGKLERLFAKGEKAFEKAKKLLEKSMAKPLRKNMPVYKGALPKAKAKMAKMPSQPPEAPPVPPGPMQPGKNQSGKEQKAEVWKGPCDFTCPYSGRCMKCPCRFQKGVCPYTKKECKCKYCRASQGRGSGSSQGQMAKKEKAQPLGKTGGKEAGKVPAGLDLKDPTKAKSRGRRTQIRGRMQKEGKTVVMAIRAFQKEKTSVEYQKVWSVEKAALEDAFRKLKLPLELRRLVKEYFESIRPKGK